ncbi:HlyD family secretion protein [Paenibacillus sp. UNCCL117]|uniref:efflux RND transporter periplasmic adaptor subunit n=1 Tax=unclassified Paenibacillus TaxID=185978 RepID=UPI0008902D01|nr:MULTISPECIES: HlyD family efflux transporter periplasmic adaptor subunit [unclassified Paenibacillus]SDC53267.1 HlyD family secretion protein [Paenibacillus sp. cl123]SFW11198.1 HlyD family secretion protein [Paenibacillus sp. UNCCL117]
MNKKKTIIITVAALLVAGAGTTVYVTQGAGKPSTGAVVQQQTAKVTRGNLQSTITGTSQLAAEQLQMITPPKEGMIKTINLTRNQTVKQGDLLLELTDTSLVEKLDNAQISLEQYKKDLQELLEQQSSLRVKAPAAGKLILSANISEGSGVSKTTKIATIADTRALIVTLPFIQEEVAQLAKGDTIQLTVDGYLITKTGVVESIASGGKADAKGNRLSEVKIRIDNDGTLDAELSVQGSVTVNGLKVESTSSAKLQYRTTTSVFANVSGTIGKLDITESRNVGAGEAIATIVNDTLDKDITTKRQQIEQQTKTIQDLNDQLANLKVYAPFDGVFSTDFADTKTNVLASYRVGSTIKSDVKLGAVASLDTLQLAISVDELDLPKVKVGQKARVRVDAISGKVYEAEVKQVSTVGTTSNGVSTYSVILGMKSSEELKYGMTASADIIVTDKKGVLLLPTQAVQSRGGQSAVMIKKADGTTERKQIKVGVNDSTNVEIVEGLAEGDEVVVGGATRSNNLSEEQIQQMRNQFQQGARGAGGGNAGFGGGGGFPGGGGVMISPGGGGGGAGGGMR